MGLGVAGSDAVNGLWEGIQGQRGVLTRTRNWGESIGGSKAYTEGLEVIDGDGIVEEVEESILEHASVAVAG